MNLLFVHQNFPAQFRHVASALAAQGRHGVTAIGDAALLRGRPALHPQVALHGYAWEAGRPSGAHHYLRELERGVRRGQAVARLALGLKQQGYRPDVVVVHPGWGEGLFLRDVFPQARQVHYFEFYYRSAGSDVGFDPAYPDTLDDHLKIRLRNCTQLVSLDVADVGVSPTHWQRAQYPQAIQDKTEVIHDGIDTDAVRPDPGAVLDLPSGRFAAGDELLTFVARNLEPYRGFHVFMRALPGILRARPQARVLIVGGDSVSYGRPAPGGRSHREHLVAELGDSVDWSRVHWLGQVPRDTYLKVLQVSRLHVYLTYPFVLSWSLLEALSAGCAVLASATPPVQEVIEDGRDGHLVGFFDTEALVARAVEMLAHPEAFQALRVRARETVQSRYDLRRHCLPRMLDLLGAGDAAG